MRVLVIGSRGAMGSRYCAILKYLGIDFEQYDILDGYQINFIKAPKPKIDKAIIATPIETHYEWCLWCISHKIDFLCEKPVSKNIEQIENLKMLCERNSVDGRMVCNWAFLKLSPKTMTPNGQKIKFDYYNTGKDSFWDLIQPIYLSCSESMFSFKRPFYNCTINDFLITQIDFDWSYIRMIESWITKTDMLWSMSDAIEATKKIIEWGKKNAKLFNHNSGKKRINKTSK